MNILFTICARKGSKGLKNKNISNFCNYPISYFTLSAYELFKDKYGYNCDLAINTDSDKLLKQVKLTKINFTHIQRTEELAGDVVGKIDVIKDTYKKMSKNYDFVIDLDLTSPLRTVEDIKGVLDEVVNNPQAELSFSATDSRRSPYFNQVKMNEDGYFEPVINKGVTARQQVPCVYDMNASIYAYRPNFLINSKGKLFDAKTKMYKMKDSAVIDIDNPEDSDLMQIIAKYFYEKYPDYNLVYENIKNILL